MALLEESEVNAGVQVVRLALSEGPQRITRRQDAVIVISEAEYERLTGKKPGFLGYLSQGTGLDELEISRDLSPMRDTVL